MTPTRRVRVYPPRGIGKITPQQEEMHEAFSLGESYRTIAARFGVNEQTVRWHVARVQEARRFARSMASP
jgi:DNA-binding CsgD family transcriptional regulator